MDCRYRVTIHDRKLAEQTKNCLKIGHYFVFAEERDARGPQQKISGRLARLLIQKADKVFPLADDPVTFGGLTFTPVPRPAARIGCIVSDRAVYRAGHDNVRLFVASLYPCRSLKLTLEMQGRFSVSRTVELTEGVALETFSGLEPGEYRARTDIEGIPSGQSIFFTVAEDKAAGLKARLRAHRFNKAAGTLFFSFSAESYRLPFRGQILASLTDKDKTLGETLLSPVSPGCYEGKIGIRGRGPFRLHLTAADDPERETEIAIPVPAKTVREASTVNELGTEMQFSILPGPDALPIRGGYLSRGDFLPTPLIVEEPVSDTPFIHVAAAAESLVLISLDLVTGRYSVQEAGDAKPGTAIRAEVKGAMSLVFAGCFVGGRPFEAYTTFISPSRLRVFAEVPAILGPGQNLRVKLRCEGTERPVPVFLRISDQGLSGSDNPSSALGASLGRCIDSAVSGMAESEILPLRLPDESGDSLPDSEPEEESAEVPKASVSPEDEPLVLSEIETEYEDIIDLSDDLEFSLSDIAQEAEESEKINLILTPDDTDPEPEFRTMEFNADQMYSALDGIRGEKKAENPGMDDLAVPDPADTSEKQRPDRDPDSGFPKVLFCDIISLAGTGEVVIPVEDCRGTFIAETFALAGADWSWHRAAVSGEQRIRVELDLPPAVHHEDHAVGRVRAFSASGKARVSLLHEGVPVTLRPKNKSDIPEEVADSPAELEFDVVSGKYSAIARDPVSGESDKAEEEVCEPGRSVFYTKELRLLQKGESLSLHSDRGILSLRVVPNPDETCNRLAKALARCPHHDCVQTAAKILAAVFMYLSAQTQGDRSEAEQIILAAVCRLQKLLIPDSGFTLYPGENTVNSRCSSLAVSYLSASDRLRGHSSLSPGLRRAVAEGLSLAERAGSEVVPNRIASPEDAYEAASAGKNKRDILKFIESFVVFSDSESFPAKKEDPAADRSALTCCAAALIAVGDPRGIGLANQVFRQMNAQALPCSVRDSAAALILTAQLGISGLPGSGARVLVNHKKMSVTEAMQTRTVESLEVTEGIVLAEITRRLEEDWGSHAYGFPVKAEFRNTGGKRIRYFKPGDRADLRVSLPEGYQDGDTVCVALPACMSRIQGEGKVRSFCIPFEGRNEVRIPVAVCSEIRGTVKFALCVRNLFDTERRASPGILSIADNFIGEKYSGKWRIVESDYSDLPRPGYVILNPYKASSFKIGRLQGLMDCRIETCGAGERIEFSWYGKIGTVIAYGRGWAMIGGEKLSGRIYIHDGDDSEFAALRV